MLVGGCNWGGLTPSIPQLYSQHLRKATFSFLDLDPSIAPSTPLTQRTLPVPLGKSNDHNHHRHLPFREALPDLLHGTSTFSVSLVLELRQSRGRRVLKVWLKSCISLRLIQRPLDTHPQDTNAQAPLWEREVIEKVDPRS